MIIYDKPNANIHVITRCLLTQGEQVVLCRAKGSEYYFFPGGHVENGENAKQALLRELIEELGEADYQIGELIGVSENLFDLSDGTKQQEVNIVFSASVPEDFKIGSVEDHIEFALVNKDELSSQKVLPEALKHSVIEWLKIGKVFYS
jgi:8-oxo-dGTP pyrophosphatase MutT (NUDIX family)